MPKGYVIVRAEVTNPGSGPSTLPNPRWRSTSSAADRSCAAAGPDHRGHGLPRNVVLEFPSYETGRGYATSPEYAEAKKLRQGAGTLDMVVVEGV